MGVPIILEQIADQLKLGTVKNRPERVMGGYMHRMYSLSTASGVYAVKLLNPVIMARPDAPGNFERAERLERVLQEHDIPIVPALEFDGRKMQVMDGQCYYLFPWVEGKALDWREIEKKHCEIVGNLLARIHRIEQREVPFERDEIDIDWASYIRAAKRQEPELAERLEGAKEVLAAAQTEFNAACKNMPPVTCICDSDMDCKNVLWADGKPLVIDLECLDYGNPYWDMFQLALSWSGSVLCHMDYERLAAFINSYQMSFGKIGVDLQSLYGIGFGWLEWLEYNVKRALMIECADEEERGVGISEANAALDRIMYYHSVKDELLQKISQILV